MTNWILEEELRKSYGFSKATQDIFREKTIEGYKADFVVYGENKTVFEAKSIISTKRSTVFPSVPSERTIEQLHKIENLLDLGWKAQYYFIALSPFVKNFAINPQYKSYAEQFNICHKKGMKVNGLGCSLLNNQVIITHKINVIT